MISISAIVLPPLGVLYGAVTRSRQALYRRGALRVFSLGAPVISVGNITAGGTGKTPLVEWLARALAAEGRRVCILTRGYKRANPANRVVVSDGKQILADEIEAGDEPFLLAKRLQGLASVISDADRIAAGQWAVKELGADVFVLDDGFQHLRVARDLDIVIVDATNPWGGGHLLPYGRLREPLQGLARSDCVVITRTDQVNNVESLKCKTRQLSHDRPVFLSTMRTHLVRRFDSDADPERLPQPVTAFCGIGNPESFFKHLRDHGHNPIHSRAFADHHSYNQKDVDALVRESKKLGAQCLITTAKDEVKLRSLHIVLPCYVLEIEMVIDNESGLLGLLREAIA